MDTDMEKRMLYACRNAISQNKDMECFTYFKKNDPKEWLAEYNRKKNNGITVMRINTKNINIPNSVMNESLGLPVDYNLDEEHKIFITDYIQKQFDEGNIKAWDGDLEGTIMKYLNNLRLSVSISE